MPDDRGERIAPQERCTVIPVRREDPVAIFQGEAGADLGRFLPGTRDVEPDPARTLKVDRLLVEGPKKEHFPEKEKQVLVAQGRIQRRVDRTFVLGFTAIRSARCSLAFSL
jgi:hypothetical protein